MARILIADDDEDLAWAWGRALTSRGHSCTTVHTGRDARALLESSFFDVLIADILMPNGGGVLLAAFRDALYPDVRILIVTGAADFEEWSDSESGVKGAEKILFKPIDNDTLADEITRILENRGTIRASAS